MSEGQIVEAIDPESAFAALADDLRIEILRALWRADNHEATFSELRAAVGSPDSGQFNYHLGQLTDQFVTKTDEGYRLTLAGHHVHGVLLAGAYTKTGNLDPIPLEDSCPACGSDRTFGYDGERASFDCTECSISSFFGVPPGVFAGYDISEWPRIAEGYFRGHLYHANNGFCPFCEGRMSPTVAEQIKTDDPSNNPPPEYQDLPTARYVCDRCGEEIASDLGSALVHRPVVVAFYHDNGVDVDEAPLSLFQTMDSDETTIHSRDPLRVKVSYTVGEETLTLIIDGELRIHESDRHDE